MKPWPSWNLLGNTLDRSGIFRSVSTEEWFLLSLVAALANLDRVVMYYKWNTVKDNKFDWVSPDSRGGA